MNELVLLSDEVRSALDDGRPVVALETTIVAHGFPAPHGREVGIEMEEAVRESGAVPATIGVLGGRIRVGLDDEELTRFDSVAGMSRSDFAPEQATSTGAVTSATRSAETSGGIG